MAVLVKNDIAAIDCLPTDGNPKTYTFYQWEHKSLYGKYIRYLHGLSNGTLVLGDYSIEDNGIYVCKVSNGVRGEHENLLQTATAVLKYHGNTLFSGCM